MIPKILPACPAHAEIVVSHSRFIASISPALSVADARAFIARIKTEFTDASHNVPAFIIGHGQSITEHCHDDGEPQGTAGRPVLAVLRGSGLGDVAVVVTRYFGGTKLGKGGLVRAYGDAVRAALEIVPRAEKVAVDTLLAAVPYPLFERTRLLIAEHGGQIIEETFAADTTLNARFRQEQTAAFQKALGEVSHGQVTGEIIESGAELILPLDE